VAYFESGNFKPALVSEDFVLPYSYTGGVPTVFGEIQEMLTFLTMVYSVKAFVGLII
jgi:hypothetical protein